MSEKTKDLLVLKVATSPEITLANVSQHLSANIKGQECAFDDASFRKVADIDRIRKIYKLGAAAQNGRSSAAFNGGSVANGKGGDEETKQLEVQILGFMALRGAT